jgi:putative DNA primase/helicase
MSAAAMFRRIERMRPTLLLDEWDTLHEENRLAALNVLNTGFKWNGVYTICVGDDHDDRDFHTFCPKAIFGLSAAKLPDTTRSRCFHVQIQKKLSSEKVEKLTRKFDGSTLRRKCLRWANDHREELSKREPVLPDGLSARQEDICEPLLAIADACGGIWPDAMRQAILHFCRQAKTDEGDAKHELLKDIQEGFRQQSPADRFSSAAMREYLNGLEHGQWGGWNDGKGISQRQIAERLRSYGITSRNIRLADGKVARGYYLADCTEAFSRYLTQSGSQSATSATDPQNIEQNQLFQSATDGNRSGRESHETPNEIKGGSTVADETSETTPDKVYV